MKFGLVILILIFVFVGCKNQPGAPSNSSAGPLALKKVPTPLNKIAYDYGGRYEIDALTRIEIELEVNPSIKIHSQSNRNNITTCEESFQISESEANAIDQLTTQLKFDTFTPDPNVMCPMVYTKGDNFGFYSVTEIFKISHLQPCSPGIYISAGKEELLNQVFKIIESRRLPNCKIIRSESDI